MKNNTILLSLLAIISHVFTQHMYNNTIDLLKLENDKLYRQIRENDQQVKDMGHIFALRVKNYQYLLNEKDEKYDRLLTDYEKKHQNEKDRASITLVSHTQISPQEVKKNLPKSMLQKFVQKGWASYYAHDFHGQKTANGEKYNMHDLTAAHVSLPFGTLVKVVNLQNGRELNVRINDRGPFVKGRIIDLSYNAAKKLNALDPTKVRIEVLQVGENTSS